MSLTIKAGATSQTVYVFIQDSSVTTGAGLTGLAFNTAGLTAYYVNNRGAATAITLATLASATAAWTSGGFIAVDGTNMAGVYRIDLPDAAVASGNQTIVTLRGATNMVPVSKEIFLTAIDMQDATAMGVSRIDAAVTSRMATYAQPTGFLAATFPGTVASTTNITAGTITTVTNLTNLPAIPNNWLTAAGIATDAITAAKVAADVGTEIGTATWAIGTRTLTAGTNIVLAKGTGITGFNDLSAAQVNVECDTALSDVGLTTTVTGRIDAAISTRLAGASYTAPDNAGITAIKDVTDKVDTTLVLDGAAYQFTANALELAPTGGSAPSAAEIRIEMDTNSTKLADILTDTGTTIPGTISTLQTATAAIKAKTDNLIFTVTGQVDANAESMNGAEILGDGTAANLWRGE